MEDCKRLEGFLDAYAAGELAGPRAEEVRLHVERCAACAKTMAEYRGMRKDLLEAADVSPQAGGAFFRGLRERLNEADGGSRRGGQPIRWHFVVGAVTAAAAALILAFEILPEKPLPASAPRVSLQEAAQGRGGQPMLVDAGPSSPAGVPGHTSPYVMVGTVDDDGRDGGFQGFGPASPLKGLEFPRQVWRVQALRPGGALFVAGEDYRRLEAKVSELEVRLEAVERAQGTGESR